MEINHNNFKAIGTKLIVELIKESSITPGGIIKPNDVVDFELWARVISAGADIKDIKPNDLIMYKAGLAKSNGFIPIGDRFFTILEYYNVEAVVSDELVEEIKMTESKMELVRKLS